MASLAAFIYSASPWAGLAVVALTFVQASADKDKPPPLLRWANKWPGHAAMALAGALVALPLLIQKPLSSDEVAELRSVYARMQDGCGDYLSNYARNHRGWPGGDSDDLWGSILDLPPPEFTQENYLRMRAATESDYEALSTVMREAVNGHSLLPSELRTLVEVTEREMRDNQVNYAAVAALPDPARFAAQVRAPLATARVLCDKVNSLTSERPAK